MAPALSAVVRYAKRIGKPPITSALYYSGYYRAQLRRLSNRAVILAYHRVGASDRARGAAWSNGFEGGVSALRFEEQMRFIRSEMTPLSLLDLADRVRQGEPLPPRAIVVTFDDGYRDNYLHALPILSRYRIPATVFVATGYVDSGRMYWWDQVFAMFRETRLQAVDVRALPVHPALASPGGGGTVMSLASGADKEQASEEVIQRMRWLPPEQLPEALTALRTALQTRDPEAMGSDLLLTWAQISEMRGQGIAFDAHTHSHRNLALLTESEVEDELRTSRAILESKLGETIAGLAYPWGLQGTYNDAVKRIAQRLGFRYGCIIGRGTVASGVDLFELARTTVIGDPLPTTVRNWLRIYALEPALTGEAGAGKRPRVPESTAR